MILVGQYDSPYVRRVAVTLHLYGMPFTRDTRSVFGDADAMRKINPLGRIPSLILDDAEILIDSGAILDYLDEQVGPARALLPANGLERRQALQTMALATGACDKAIALTYERLIRPASVRHQPWIDRCLTQIETALVALEARAFRPAANAQQPEITTAAMIAYLKLRNADAFPLGRFPHLEALSVAMEATAAFQATQAAANETIPVSN